MIRPRPSLFRDALQVSPERIAAMGETDLNDLMKELLHAHAHRCRSPLSGLSVNTENKAKDDGCDAWTTKPELDDDWLGDSNTCWQFKAGVSGRPSRLKGEVVKRIPKKTLEEGGRLVVVATGSTNGRKGEDTRLKTLREKAKKFGIPTSKIAVIGSERLTTWCNQHPAVAARWAGRPNGMWTLGDWASDDVHQVQWQVPEKVQSELTTLRAALEFEGGSVLHLHIHGQPGVGKTRYALELCREAPWRRSVIYLPQATDLRVVELIDSAADDAGVRLMVVVDEVQPELMLSLRNSISRANGRIRLITVGHCPTPDPARIPAVAVAPLDPQMASEVVKAWYPAMPAEHVAFVVRFADGYVRLARLAAGAVAASMAIDIRGLLGRDEIRGFLDGMLGQGERRALHVVAVLSSVGWTEDKQAEGEAVAKHLGLNWNDVRATVEDFHRRLGIAPRGGRYRYISPTPLGIHLAVEAWTTYPDLLRTLPEVLPTEGAKDAYYERLQSIASNPQARQYAREELSFFFRIDDFLNARAVRRWSALSAADPDQAARNILRALAGSSTETRSRIEGSARREIVWTLVRLAWQGGAFRDAVHALAFLAEAENETWANNATAEFVGRFQIFLGGTAVPYVERLPVLDELLNKQRPALNRLVVKALGRASERQAFRIESTPASDGLPEREWHPSNVAENLRCVEAALERLVALAQRALPELENEFITVANEFSMILREAPVRPSVERLFNAVRTAYPDAREPLRRTIADIVESERKYWNELSEEELAQIEAFHTRFEGASLNERLRQYVGQPQWEQEERPDLRPLARELIETPDALAREWSWLTSGDAGDAWRLGEALAEEDPGRVLANTMASFPDTGRDLRLLCGYTCAWRRTLGDYWYEQWIETQLHKAPRPVNLLFELAWRCGATNTVARHIGEVLGAESVAPEIVGQLGFGTWGDGLSPDVLEEVLRAMIDAGHSATALAILARRTRSVFAEREGSRSLALRLVTDPELVRSHHTTNYYWKVLAMSLVGDHPGEIAAGIIGQHGDRSSGTWFAQHSQAAHVLYACVEEDPGAVWSALLCKLSSKVSAYTFGVGFPRGVVERVPPELVLAWIAEQPDVRAAIIAKFVSKDFSSDSTLAARVIGTFGGKEDVATAFFAEFVSGSWWGPASAHWDKLAATAAQIAARSKLPKLRRWAADAARDLRRMAERDRQREEEEDLRRR